MIALLLQVGKTCLLRKGIPLLVGGRLQHVLGPAGREPVIRCHGRMHFVLSLHVGVSVIGRTMVAWNGELPGLITSAQVVNECIASNGAQAPTWR